MCRLIKKTSVFPTIAFTLFLLFIAFLLPTVTRAQFQFEDPLGVGQVPPQVFIIDIIKRIIIFFLGLVGIIALAAITYGSIRLIIGGATSESEIAQAKRVIFWAAMGLIVVGLSLTIIIEVGNILGLPLF